MRALWHALHDHFNRSSNTLRFQNQFEDMRRRWTLLRPFRDPAALLDHLHAPGGEPAARNAILRELVGEAQAEDSDTAVMLLLLALWPGLDAVHRRLSRHFRGRPEELVSEISERATRGIRTLDLAAVTWIAATVIRNIERDTRRMLRVGWKDAALRDELPDHWFEDRPNSVLALPDGTDADAAALVLEQRVRSLIGADATIVMAVAVLGDRQQEAAERLGIGAEAARKRYQRALRRLRLHLLELA